MSSGGPDLFVVCKSCQSEVSPYITECPYCGARLRKRAPKLDRHGRPQAGRRRPSRPNLGRLRPGEIPGIRADTSRPWVAIAAVVVSLVGLVLWRANAFQLADVYLPSDIGGEWWRILTAPFAYATTGYAFVALTAVALFGWLLERRHGHVAALVLVLLCGCGSLVVAAATGAAGVIGGNGMALGLLGAWAVPPLAELRRGEEPDADLIGAGVFAAVLLLLPVVVVDADAVAGIAGLLIGLAAGVPLARFTRAV